MRCIYVFIATMSLILFCGAVDGISATDRATDITLVGDVWPPYVMDPKEGRNGFIVDVAIAAFAKSGYKVKYINSPWTRALQDTLDGKFDGVVGIYFSDAKEKNLIIPNEEIGRSVNRFYVTKESSWKYTGVQSLKRVILGVINGYDYGEINQYLDSERKNNSRRVVALYEDKALEININKLIAGRIDAVVEDQLVMSFVSAKLGVGNRLKDAGVSKPSNKVGIAFSPKSAMSVEYAKALSSGIKTLRATGELKAILAKYRVNDWK